MADMMDGNAALNRRSNLPTRIAQDRPAQKAKQLLWGTIAAGDRYKMPLREQQIIRTIKRYAGKQKGNQRHDMTTAQKARKRKEKRNEEKEQNKTGTKMVQSNGSRT